MHTPEHKHNNAGNSVPHPRKSGLPGAQWGPARTLPRSKTGGMVKAATEHGRHPGHTPRAQTRWHGVGDHRAPGAHRTDWQKMAPRGGRGPGEGGGHRGGFRAPAWRGLRRWLCWSPTNATNSHLCARQLSRAIVTEPRLEDGPTTGLPCAF